MDTASILIPIRDKTQTFSYFYRVIALTEMKKFCMDLSNSGGDSE